MFLLFGGFHAFGGDGSGGPGKSGGPGDGSGGPDDGSTIFYRKKNPSNKNYLGRL